MAKAIIVSITILIIFLTVVTLIYRAYRHSTKVGDLTQKQEHEMRRLLSEAAHVMRGIGIGMHIDDSDVVSDRSRRAIENWLVRYEDHQQKEINA